MSPVRMTASAAEAYFAARPRQIGAHQVTEHILDLVQLSNVDHDTRVALGFAADDLAAGRRETPALRTIAGAHNRLARGRIS